MDGNSMFGLCHNKVLLALLELPRASECYKLVLNQQREESAKKASNEETELKRKKSLPSGKKKGVEWEQPKPLPPLKLNEMRCMEEGVKSFAPEGPNEQTVTG